MRFSLKATRGRKIIIIVKEDRVIIIRRRFGNTCGGDSPDHILVYKEDKEQKGIS